MKPPAAAVLLAFALCQSNLGATGIDEFMGIAWGSIRSEVASKMAELDYAKDPDSNADTDIYVGMFASRKSESAQQGSD